MRAARSRFAPTRIQAQLVVLAASAVILSACIPGLQDEEATAPGASTSVEQRIDRCLGLRKKVQLWCGGRSLNDVTLRSRSGRAAGFECSSARLEFDTNCLAPK